MKIFVGADHRGYRLKAKIIKLLSSKGYEVIDGGSFSDKPCDYPAISYRIARAVVSSPQARGILICMSGIGHTIAANKVPGAYAALCYNKKAAQLSREHNNSNILVLGAKFVTWAQMQAIIRTWLKTDFSKEARHARRLRQIKAMENELFKK